MKKIKSDSRVLYAVTWSLLIASVGWSFIMPQHAYVHTFTSKHFGIWYGIVAAYGVFEYIRIIKSQLADTKYALAMINILVCGYAFVMFLTQQAFELYLKFGLAYPALGK